MSERWSTDRQNHVFDHVANLGSVLPQLALLAFVSLTLRYARWRWLLGRRDFRIAWLAGFLSYMAGSRFRRSAAWPHRYRPASLERRHSTLAIAAGEPVGGRSRRRSLARFR
jgi:hypothetical protein